MPLSDHEEEALRQIAAQLRAEDPGLSGRIGKLSGRLSTTATLVRPAVGVLLSLAALPVAAATGRYELGMLAYLLGCFAAVRLLRCALGLTGTRQAATPAPVPNDPSSVSEQVRVEMVILRRQLAIAGIGILAALAIVASVANGPGTGAPIDGGSVQPAHGVAGLQTTELPATHPAMRYVPGN
jgi:hypothetical protein